MNPLHTRWSVTVAHLPTHPDCAGGTHRGPFTERPDIQAGVMGLAVAIGEDPLQVPRMFDCHACGSTINESQLPAPLAESLILEEVA